MYKAISNPIYICQTEDDPILKAFVLSAELSKEASFDKEFYPDYKALSHVSEILFLIQIYWILIIITKIVHLIKRQSVKNKIQ